MVSVSTHNPSLSHHACAQVCFSQPSSRHALPASSLLTTPFFNCRPFASRVASEGLKLLIKSLCTIADDLVVDINASSNIALLSGQLNAVSVTSSRIVYNGFAVSGGAALYTDEICLAARYPGLPLAAVPRLAKPFSVSIRATLTENDLNRPGPVRDALQSLLRQIIATGLSGAIGREIPTEIGGLKCILDEIELVDATERKEPPRFLGWVLGDVSEYKGGKIVLHAHAVLSSGQTIHFAVRTGLTTEADGHILKLSEPELLWRNMAFPMVTIDMIGVKLDSTTKLTNVEVNQHVVSGDGIMVISPPTPPSKRLSAGRERRAPKSSSRWDNAESRKLVRGS